MIESENLELIRQWRQKPVKPISVRSKSNQFKFAVLTVLGTLYFACEGFDGMTALLGIFSLPGALLLASGILFSFLSVVIFYSFDLVEISKNLGVSRKQTPQLIDLYVDQLSEMKALVRSIQEQHQTLKGADKKTRLDWLAQIETQYHIIDEQSKKLGEKLKHPGIDLAQSTVTILAGLIHFSGGFFAGQTPMTFLCTALAVSTAPTFWPIMVFSLFIGLAALAVYWYVEKPGIEKFVSRWVGIDGEKLEKLQKPLRIKNQLVAIEVLKTVLETTVNSAANDARISDGTVHASTQSMHV